MIFFASASFKESSSSKCSKRRSRRECFQASDSSTFSSSLSSGLDLFLFIFCPTSIGSSQSSFMAFADSAPQKHSTYFLIAENTALLSMPVSGTDFSFFAAAQTKYCPEPINAGSCFSSSTPVLQKTRSGAAVYACSTAASCSWQKMLLMLMSILAIALNTYFTFQLLLAS